MARSIIQKGVTRYEPYRYSRWQCGPDQPRSHYNVTGIPRHDGGLPVRSLRVEVTTQGDPTRARVSADTENISRIDAYVDGRPRMTLDVQDGSTTFDLPLDPPDAHELELRGFDSDELVARRRIEL